MRFAIIAFVASCLLAAIAAAAPNRRSEPTRGSAAAETQPPSPATIKRVRNTGS